MASTTNDLREFQHSEEGFHTRAKIDGFWPFESANVHHMDNAEALISTSNDQPVNSDSEAKYDFRKSMAWDMAFFTSPGVLDMEELFQSLNFRDSENGISKYENNGQKLPSESLTTETASRIGEWNVRRSLAWDSAFFTSEGVLDPEELCLINKGFKKFEAHSLPGVQEELCWSTESSVTIDSEYSLDSLEFELFDGMKASMLKSSKASNAGLFSSKMQKGVGTRKLISSRKSNAPVKMMKKSFPASGKQTVKTLREGRIPKEVGIPTRSLRVSQLGRTNPTSSPKPSKMCDQAETLAAASAKKVFLSGNNAKAGNRIRKAAPGQNVAKKPCLGDLCCEPQSLSESPGPASSHYDSSLKESAGSDSGSYSSISKSPQSSLRRKKDMGLAACDSNSRTTPKSLTRRRIEQVTSSQPVPSLPIPKSSSKSPSRTSPLNPLPNSTSASKSSARSRTESLNSSQPTHCLPTPKSSCRSPPYTSVDQEKSSSSLHSTVFLKAVSVGSDACKTLHIGNHACDASYVENGRNESMLLRQQVGLILKGNSPLVPTVIEDTKPSGLRKPSPKLGFFDVEICMPSVPNEDMKFHSGAYNASRTSGINSLNGTSNRVWHNKLHSARSSTRNGNVKMNSPRTGVPCFSMAIKPASPTQFAVQNGSKESCLISEVIRSCPENELSFELNNGYGYKRGGLQCNLVDEDQEAGGIMNKKKFKNTEEFLQNVKKPYLKQNEDAANCLAVRDDHKENLCSIDNQVDELSRSVEAIDLSRDLVIEF